MAINLLQFSEAWTQRDYTRKQIIVYAGDEVNQFYYLKNGYVKLYTISQDGEERILLILKPGDLFPLLKDPTHSGHTSLYFYAAMTDCELSLIEQQEIINEMKKDPESSWKMLRYISEFSNNLTNRLALLESKKAEDKLSNLFTYLITVCSKPTKQSFYMTDLKLTHQDIANLIGVTRETVSVALKNLEDQNKVVQRNGYLVIDKQYAPSE